MNKTSIQFAIRALLVAALTFSVLTGCKSQSASREGAKQGAAGGALGGAVGGFFWGLISGNPVEGAVKGAAVGGGTGAVLGGARGAKSDRDMKKQYGETNYEALIALIYRDYEKAKEKVALTAEDSNPTYRLVSAWISALIARETLSSDEMEPYYQKLVELDDTIENREDAKVEIRLGQRDLAGLRKRHNTK